jgi:hypothetical protein
MPVRHDWAIASGFLAQLSTRRPTDQRVAARVVSGRVALSEVYAERLGGLEFRLQAVRAA